MLHITQNGSIEGNSVPVFTLYCSISLQNGSIEGDSVPVFTLYCSMTSLLQNGSIEGDSVPVLHYIALYHYKIVV